MHSIKKQIIPPIVTLRQHGRTYSEGQSPKVFGFDNELFVFVHLRNFSYYNSLIFVCLSIGTGLGVMADHDQAIEIFKAC